MQAGAILLLVGSIFCTVGVKMFAEQSPVLCVCVCVCVCEREREREREREFVSV
jgi:hypothetical protein